MKKMKIINKILYNMSIIMFALILSVTAFYVFTFKHMKYIETKSYVYKYGILAVEYDTLAVSRNYNKNIKSGIFSDTIYNKDNNETIITNRNIEVYTSPNTKEFIKTSIDKIDYDKLGIEFVVNGKKININ